MTTSISLPLIHEHQSPLCDKRHHSISELQQSPSTVPCLKKTGELRLFSFSKSVITFLDYVVCVSCPNIHLLQATLFPLSHTNTGTALGKHRAYVLSLSHQSSLLLAWGPSSPLSSWRTSSRLCTRVEPHAASTNPLTGHQHLRTTAPRWGGGQRWCLSPHLCHSPAIASGRILMTNRSCLLKYCLRRQISLFQAY